MKTFVFRFDFVLAHKQPLSHKLEEVLWYGGSSTEIGCVLPNMGHPTDLNNTFSPDVWPQVCLYVLTTRHRQFSLTQKSLHNLNKKVAWIFIFFHSAWLQMCTECSVQHALNSFFFEVLVSSTIFCQMAPQSVGFLLSCALLALWVGRNGRSLEIFWLTLVLVVFRKFSLSKIAF